MPGRFIGHRGARDSEWSWEHEDEEHEATHKRRWPLAVLLSGAVIAGVAAFAFGVFLVISNNDGNAAPPVVSLSPTPTTSPTPAVTVTPGLTSSPSPTASPTPTLAPTPAYSIELSAWSDVTSSWTASSLDDETSAYEEGDSVPILLLIERARPGDTYDVQIRYDCMANGEPAFDYLSGAEQAGEAPLLTPPGPGRAIPDSSLTMPDDPSIDFDGASTGSMQVWGAVFSDAGYPTPDTECTRSKTMDLSLLARDDTVTLVWTAHLASEEDWGAGSGASAAAPFSLRVQVNGEVAAVITVEAGALSR